MENSEGGAGKSARDGEMPCEGEAAAADRVWPVLFEASLDAMLVADDEGRYRRVNRAACELLGYSREEFRKLRIHDISPEAPEALDQHWERFLEAGRESGEFELRHRDGHPVSVRYTGIAHVLPGRHLAVFHDTGPLRRALRGATERAARQETVAALGREALSGKSVRELVDRAVAEVAQVLDAELIEVMALDENGEVLRDVADLGWPAELGPQETPVAGSAAGKALELREPLVVEPEDGYAGFPASETLREHGATSGVSITIEGFGAPFGVLGAYSRSGHSFGVEDVSFLDAVANVLGAAFAAERTAELEVQLEQAHRMQALGQLASGVSHDFRNLLAVIVNYLDFAVADVVAGERPELAHLEEAALAAQQGVELTSSLLGFSREREERSEPLDIREAIESTVGLLERTLGEQVVLETRLADSLPGVTLGVGEVGQILINLAANARDAPGTSRVSIIAQEVAIGETYKGVGINLEPGRYVRLEISDDGQGMDHETVRKAFDPFFTTKLEGRGTGLGLATVYGVVQRVGGHVAINSQPGVGTTVRAFLPAAVATTSSDPRETGELRARGGSERVLLVEDDPGLRKLTEMILEHGGYRVTPAPGPREALALYDDAAGAGEPIELLLSDVFMPEMSGPDLAAQLRDRSPGLRCALMTGYSADALVASMPEPTVVIEKPFKAETLLSGVRKALDGSRVGAGRVPGGPPSAGV